MKLIAGWNGGKNGPTCPDVEGPCCGPVFYTPMGLGTETDAIVVSEVSQERADWKAEQIALRVNNHERLVEALKLSMLGLEAMIEDGRCGDTFTATALHLDNCNALLAALEAEKGGEL